VPVSAGHDLRARSSGSTTAGRAPAARPASPAHEPREAELRHLPLRSDQALRPARPTPRSIGGHLGGVPAPDIEVWTDGSTEAGTTNGGAGALILEHGESRTAQLTAPAGRLCSRTQADLTAIEIALRRPQAGLGDDDRPTAHVTRRSALISGRAALSPGVPCRPLSPGVPPRHQACRPRHQPYRPRQLTYCLRHQACRHVSRRSAPSAGVPPRQQACCPVIRRDAPVSWRAVPAIRRAAPINVC